MGLKKGQTGNPNGRPRGTKNKATADLRKAVNELLDNNWVKIQKDIDKLEPKDRLIFMEKLLSYSLPKLQSIEMKAELSSRIEGLNAEQLNRLIDHILTENSK